jgi:hypothetical protein
MKPMNASPVIAIDNRRRRVSHAVAARRRLDRAPFPGDRRSERRDARRATGRVWLNGVEVGGTDPRHSSLADSYD